MCAQHHPVTAADPKHRFGNLLRWLMSARGCVILGSLSGDGLARESAAVAPSVGVFWLTNGLRPVPCPPARTWLKRGLLCRKLHCPPRQVHPG